MRFTDILLIMMFLFFIGSTLGWIIEVLFRRFFTAKKWINPGFLTGPYLPLYGFGVVGLFGISIIPIDTGIAWLNSVIMILIMGTVMTLIEYIAGLIFIKGMKIRLWDYSDRKGNIQGIICPLFSFFWLVVSALFYFIIDKKVIDAVTWFVHHIEFAFVVGIFVGVFVIDVAHSLDLTAKIRKFAQEHSIIVNIEKLKEALYDKVEEVEQKHPNFIFPLKSFSGFKDQMSNVKEKFSSIRKTKKNKEDKKDIDK
ncbi:MAG: putative ABC transporter permease [Clostridiales bacterium]|nr:putative ABC transporter permease [Clostridiales bacterium]